jgi:hypothetical protein
MMSGSGSRPTYPQLCVSPGWTLRGGQERPEPSSSAKLSTVNWSVETRSARAAAEPPGIVARRSTALKSRHPRERAEDALDNALRDIRHRVSRSRSATAPRSMRGSSSRARPKHAISWSGPRRAGRSGLVNDLPARDFNHRIPSRSKAAAARYRKSVKGKAVNNRYGRSAKGKAADARYGKSAKGKAAAKKYRQSEAGRKAKARARAKAKTKPAAS